MTGSPINLEEAHEIIAAEKTCQCHENRFNRDRGVAIRLQYLESIVSELEAGRERIAELEAEYIALKEIHEDEVDMIRDEFSHAIIPQAEDADRLTELESWMTAQRDDAEAEGIDISFIDEQLVVIRRYLAAIGGGKP